MRNSKGDILGAKNLKIVIPLTVVEIVSIRKQLSYCFEKQLSKVIIKTYSLDLVHILNEEWEVP